MIFQTFKIFLEVFVEVKEKALQKIFVSLKRQIQEDERRKNRNSETKCIP